MALFRIKNKTKKRVLGLFCLFTVFIALFLFILPEKSFAQERPLEVEYPEIRDIKPETVTFGVAEYVKYIFNFIIAISGLIAFAALIWGGVQYLTSTGEPEKLKKARKQVLAAFLGIIILLFSYLTLYTIDPQLVVFDLPELIELPPYEPELPEVRPPVTDTPLGKTAEVAQDLRVAAAGIAYYTGLILTLTEKCDCENVWSICLCLNYYGECKGIKCRLGPDSHPCPDWPRIKEYQQRIIAFKNEILYYKNRIEAEREDLIFEIEQLWKKIEYYEKRIKAEEAVLKEVSEKRKIAIKDQERIIDHLKGILNRMYVEAALKGEVVENLSFLFDFILELTPLIESLAESPDSLIDSCWQEVNEVCGPNCRGGCHDAEGCFPKECSGGNSCKVNEIESTVESIKEKVKSIIVISEDVFDAHGGFEEIRDIGWLPFLPPPLPEGEILAWPVNPVRCTADFGEYRPWSLYSLIHQGMDFGKETTGIYAAADGEVTIARTIDASAAGKYVQILHEGLETADGQTITTRYLHLEEVLVEKGDIIEQGKVIGIMGETGYGSGIHLHFDVCFDDKCASPNLRDHPFRYLPPDENMQKCIDFYRERHPNCYETPSSPTEGYAVGYCPPYIVDREIKLKDFYDSWKAAPQ